MAVTPEDRLRPWLTYPAWIVCLLLIVLAPCFPVPALRWQFFPFALGLVLLGLPHGAMDHLAGPHLLRRPLTRRYLLCFVIGYLALTLCVLLLWRVRPLVGLILFLVLSLLHWGQGDYDHLRLFEGRDRPGSALGVLLIWLVRGGLPIVLPVLAFPATFARVAVGLTRWYGGAGLPAPGPGVVRVGAGVLLLLVALYLRQAWRAGGLRRRGGWWRDAGELALLLLLFRRVPPLLAVGTYFCVWHSARHIGRLMLVDPVTSSLLTQGRMRQAIGRTVLQSLPMTVGAIALLLILFGAQHQYGTTTLPGLVFLYLSLIAALTVPHFLVVLWMDHRQRL